MDLSLTERSAVGRRGPHHSARPPLRPGRRAVLRGLATAAVLATAGCSRGDGPDTGAAPSSPPRPTPTTAPRPVRGRRNVIVVSVDDLGWQELGCYGSDFNETPEIDRMAAEGMRFTQAYSAAPLCSPSRAALMTGLYPGRTGITDFLRPEPATSDNFLSTDLDTVPDVLGPRGYTCGLVGKWHLSETYSGPYEERPGSPFSHGFDDVRVIEQEYIGSSDYFAPYAPIPDLPGTVEGEYLTDRLAEEIDGFIADHRDEPFYVHLSNYAVHTALAAKPDLVAKYTEKAGGSRTEDEILIAAMLESVDQQVGRIRRALDREGLTRRTVVMVTSDNGGSNRERNEPLRGGKGELFEGGIRVPLVVWGPGTVLEGETSDLVTNGIDSLATAAELAGRRVPDSLDGISIAATLTGRGEQTDRDAVYWAYPHFIGRTRPHAAVRSGDLKAVMWLRDGRTELYDVVADPGETRDLAERAPRDVARLKRMLLDHVADLDMFPGPPVDGAGDVVETFDDGDLGAYDVVGIAGGGAAATEVRGGRLRISAEGGVGQALAISTEGPGRAPEWSMVLDPGGLPGRNRERTLYAGLALDGGTHVLLRYRHDLGRVGWDLRVDGELLTGGAEPLDNLDGSVDLSGDGARLALCMRGGLGAAYADAGDGWEFLFRFDVSGAIDLGDPGVQAGCRYVVGGRVEDGMVSVDGFTASA